MNILVLNCGSSSVKYSVWDLPDEKEKLSGIIECINIPGITCRHTRRGEFIPEELKIESHEEAINYIIDLVNTAELGEINVIGHRVVQGGGKFQAATLVTPEVKDAISSYFDIAPLHNPSNLKGILACENKFKGIRNIAVFDTAFHSTISEAASTYAIPKYLAKKYGLKKYGFHGISHKYVSVELAAARPELKKIISCHLGNGSSITAIKDGFSVDTSMGFSPLEGLVMGTRPGDLDPEIPLYIMEKEGISTSEMLSLLNKHSGVLGISGISSDMRKLLESEDHAAALAIDVFCLRIKKYIGSYIGVLNGCDAIVFTGGIGENSSVIRNKILSELDVFGIKIDEEKNSSVSRQLREISDHEAKTRVFVIPSNEELMIAREAFALLSNLTKF